MFDFVLFYIKVLTTVLSFSLFISVASLQAEMIPVSEGDLESVSGKSGISLSMTGLAGISIQQNASIGFSTGSVTLSASDLILEDCTVINKVDHDNNPGTEDQANPVTVSVETAENDSDTLLPTGTGYIQLGLPSASVTASSWGGSIEITNGTGGGNLFDVSSTLNLNVIQGTILIYPH